MISRRWFTKSVGLIFLVAGCFVTSFAWSQSAEREWSDVTGAFKIKASLIEVKEGVAYLKNAEGKIFKVPVTKLSATDQAFLKEGANPFEEMVQGAPASKPSGSPANPGAVPTNGSPSPSQDSSNPFGNWNDDSPIDWSSVRELDRGFGSDAWKLELPVPSDSFKDAKRATLTKKNNSSEDIRRLEINPIANRAVIGYTFSDVFKKTAQSRFTLVDLTTGKAVHSAGVEADMCPMCLLNDGSSVLMYGTSDERRGFEQRFQVQLWKLNGKNVARSKLWVPFPAKSERTGKMSGNSIVEAIPMVENRLILRSSKGHLVCIDAITRQPYWQAKLSEQSAIHSSSNGKLLAVLDKHTVLIVDPVAGKSLCSKPFTDKPNFQNAKIRWSPSETRLLVHFDNSFRVLDLKTGEWTQQFSVIGANISGGGLSYPDDDYALVDNRLLIHLGTQIRVCDYRDATRITSVGDTSFIAIQKNDGGILVPAKVPHPAAAKALQVAEKDPSIFLIKPGVEVDIDTSGAGQWSNDVRTRIEEAVATAGYQIKPGAPIRILGQITGPKTEAVSYIGAGAYVVNSYTATVKITWQNKDVWVKSGNNIPGILDTKPGQSIQDRLDELGKQPSFWVFDQAAFPKLLQRPSEEKGNNNISRDALMYSTFTMQGLVDSK